MQRDIRPNVEVVLFSKHFTRNIKALFEILDNSVEFSKKVIWLTYSYDSYDDWKDVVPTVYWSSEIGHQHTWNMIENAKILITDDVIPESTDFDWLCRNLLRIQLWHGVPYKDIGLSLLLRHDVFQGYKVFSKFLDSSDFFLVPTESDLPMYKRIFPKAKHFVLPEPKIQTIFSENSSSINSIEKYTRFKESLPPNCFQSVFLWAPTFREVEGVWDQDLPNYLNTVCIENNVLLVCKPHPHDQYLPKLNFEGFSNIYLANDSEDVYDYIRIVDGVISDYSSLLIELHRLGIPVTRWIPDESVYIARHGTLETNEIMNVISKHSNFSEALESNIKLPKSPRLVQDVSLPWINLLRTLLDSLD